MSEVTDIDRAHIRRILEHAVHPRDLDWMASSCPSVSMAIEYALTTSQRMCDVSTWPGQQERHQRVVNAAAAYRPR